MSNNVKLVVRAMPVSDANPVPVNLVPTPADATVVAGTSGSGTKTITASATPERLSATDVFVGSVNIYPLESNTDAVFAGYGANPQGEAPIAFGPYTDGKKVNLKEIWIRSKVNGEGVAYDTET